MPAILRLLLPPVYLKEPSLKVPFPKTAPASVIGLKVQKLFVGVSLTASTLVPPKPLGVKLLPLPLISFPWVEAVVELLSSKLSLKPLLP